MKLLLEKLNFKVFPFIFITIGLILLGIHLYFFTDFQPSWYDNVLFNSASASLHEGKGFLADAHPLYNGGREMLMHGPVYYVLQSWVIGLLGNSHFNFLIIPFICLSLITIILFRRETKYVAAVAVILLLSDAIFSKAIHNGRMDILASFFIFIIYYLSAHFTNKKKDIIYIAILSGLAFLTTPRIVVLIAPSILWIIYNVIKSKNYNLLIYLITIPLLMIVAWLYFGFGGLENAFNYFFVEKTMHHNVEGNLVSKFVGGNWTIFKSQWAATITFIFLFFLGIFNKTVKSKPWFWIISSTILLFYIMVKDVGLYSSLFLPLLYLFISKLSIETFNRNYQPLLLGVLFFNSLIIGVKSYYIFYAKEYNTSNTIKQVLTEYTNETDKICGSLISYFSVLEVNREFRLFCRFEVDMDENMKDIINDKDIDYLILNTYDQKLFNTYEYPYKLEEVYEFNHDGAKYLEVKEKLNSTPLKGNFLNPEYELNGMKLYKVKKHI
ncbi:MAG: glycosyltransferase family 39 protein [Flavobacteriales bacterium]